MAPQAKQAAAKVCNTIFPRMETPDRSITDTFRFLVRTKGNTEVSDDTKVLDVLMEQKDYMAITNIVETTSSLAEGEKALAFLQDTPFANYVKQLSTWELKCKLPALRETAKKIHQAWADLPQNLDKYLEQNKVDAVIDIITTTSSLELGKKGISFLLDNYSFYVREIYTGQMKCNLPELQEVAKEVWMRAP